MDRGRPRSKLHYLPPAATLKKVHGIVSTPLVRLNVTAAQRGQPNRWVSRSRFSPLAASHRRSLLTFGRCAACPRLRSNSFFFFPLSYFFLRFRRCPRALYETARGQKGAWEIRGKRSTLINLVKVQPVTDSATRTLLPIIWFFHHLRLKKQNKTKNLK